MGHNVKQSMSSSSGPDMDMYLAGSKRPRRQATLKKEDSQDPYIYTTNIPKGTTRRPRGNQIVMTSQAVTPQKKRGPKPGSTKARRTVNLAPPADFGAKLFASLKADISSDETGGRRRRAYTEMDDLLADDLKQQGEQMLSENELRPSTPLSDKGDSSRKRQQLSDLGGANKSLVSI